MGSGSHQSDPSKSEDRRKPRADWTAWTFHLIFGAFIGGVLGFYLAARMYRISLVEGADMLWVACGVSLLAAGLGSHFGDRAWMRPSLFDAEPPPRSDTSKLFSIIFGVVGAVLILAPCATHLFSASQASVHGRMADGRWVLLPPLILLSALVIHALHTGTVLSAWFAINRDDSPVLFWFLLALYGIGILACVLALRPSF